MDPGRRDQLITIERAGEPFDDGYTTREGEWASYTQTWARVLYGTGQERREAAQERADQTATFECEYNPTLAQVGVTDRIQFMGATWDITSVAFIGRAREIHLTAARSS